MKRQGGFALVELLIATAITGIIAGVLGTAVFQIIDASGYGNDKLTALHELQNAAYWFNLDGQKAAAASVNGGLLLTVSDNSSITYSLSGTELQRTAGGSTVTLARNISQSDFSLDNRTITMTITSSPEGRDNVNQQGTYKVSLRPSGG